MAPVWKSYTREIYRSLHYLAAWPPTRTLAVGDIVVFEGRSPERQLSLTDLGYDFEVRSDPDLRNRGWASNGSVRAEPMAEASSPVHPGVKVGLGLKLVFEDKHRFLLRAERSREQTMERLDQVNDEIFRLHDEGKWRREWRLITHVIQAEKTMVLLSEGRNVSADLEVSADIGLDPLSVARGQGAVKLLRSSAGLNYEAGDNVTTLYQARRIKTLFGRGTKQVGKRGRARAGLGELHVVEEEF